MLIFIYILLFIKIYLSYNLDPTKLKVNYFKENTKLYYVNAFNDDNGDLYFEFWGENDNYRYFIGKNFTTEEDILFNGKKILIINSYLSSRYHESIIVKNNKNFNVFSIDYQNINLISLNNENITSQETKNIVTEYRTDGDFSMRNSVIKLKNNNYIISIILRTSCSWIIYCNHVNIISFNFTENNVNSFNIIDIFDRDVSFSNSTECFETKNQFIQCLFTPKIPSNQFTIFIYDTKLTEMNNAFLGYFPTSSFTKIFHLKEEIGIYIYFNDRDNYYGSTPVPKIFIEKLEDFNLIDIFEFDCDSSSTNNYKYIILNADGIYTLDSCLFCSDSIKINETKFIVVLTIKDTSNLLLCLFDIYNNDSSLRLRYLELKLSDIGINISVNLRAFIFKENFGLIFYDSNYGYPGYMFFNYSPDIKNDKTIEIKLFNNCEQSYNFTIQAHIEIVNNLYGGSEKIKIINYPSPNETGIIIKSLKLNSEISINQFIDFNEINFRTQFRRTLF